MDNRDMSDAEREKVILLKIEELKEKNQQFSISELSGLVKMNYYIVDRIFRKLEQKGKIKKKIKTRTFAYWE